MKKVKSKLILLHEDYQLLKTYIKSLVKPNPDEKNNSAQIASELKDDPILVHKKDLPEDAICLNSEVTVQDKATGRKMELKVVLPWQANAIAGRVSVFAPMGTALMGYRKGQMVKWQMPGGKKGFLILDVLNKN